MKLNELFCDHYQIVAVMDADDTCPTVDFLTEGEESTRSNREALTEMMKHIAKHGFANTPSVWSHEADKSKGIYELIKGNLRVFFFKGKGNQIIVCTHGMVKKGQKASKREVNIAHSAKQDYWTALNENKLEVV